MPAAGDTGAGPGTRPDPPASWADRAADRSPAVQRSRTRSVQQVRGIVEAARRLIRAKGSSFTTQELVKEAGVALQTFYRHFAGKDELLLAVFEEEIGAEAERTDAAARLLSDPVARLHFLITSTLESLRDQGDDQGGEIGPRFITAEHWRLHQLFPDEMARINQPFADLIERNLREAAATGLLRPSDPAADAWLAMELVMSVYHHYAFATAQGSLEDIAEGLWTFCLAAFGGDSGVRPSNRP
ncbi:TetR family transcriptional regulator [Actinomadura cremea]|nr:TetR family transcriptional regulator [Actinomadura cremea]